MRCLSRLTRVAMLLATLLGVGPATQAADSPFTAIMPYVDNQTFLIGRLDVQQLPVSDLKSRLPQLLAQITGEAGVPDQFASVVDQAIRLREGFLTAGGQDVFLIVSTADIPQPPLFFVVTATDPRKLDALESFIRQLINPQGPGIRKDTDRAVLVGSPHTLDRLDDLKAAPRPEVQAATAAVAAAPLQLLLVPSADQHRVLQETLPAFPPPWERITGPALSDAVQWAALTVAATPTIQARLVVASKDAAAAETFQHMLDASLDAVAQLPAVQQVVPEAGRLRTLIEPVVTGKQVSVTVTEDAATLQALSRPVAAAIAAARANAQRATSVSYLKQIAVAMHNYHDTYKRFPPAATCDAAGKPLLSWRVQLLPFLGEDALYRQFKLDEPWDSEHNKQLIDRMPRLFADPAARLKPGMTTYQVPIGEGTVFGGKEALRLQDIKDGTSNTILVVNVTPDRAVVWTKPEDLPVTEAAPLTALVSDARKQFDVALCDGSVRILTSDIDPKVLWLLFNANDGQVIDYSQIR